VAGRINGTRCPYCTHRVSSPDFNLATVSPALAAEWHPTKNGKLTANQVLPSASRKVWWRCAKGHDFNSTINSRASGTGCPYCSNKRIGYGNSLIDRFPSIAKEWHPTRNGELTPSNIVFGSSRNIWWQCARGHEWETKVIARTHRNTNCPKCKPQASKLELRIFAEMLPIFGKIERQKKLWRKEFDLVIESLKVCVEVDGYPWHNDKVDHDLLKLKLCRKHGYNLFRVRDKRLPAIDGPVVIYSESALHSQFHTTKALILLISKLVPHNQEIRNRIVAYRRKSRWQNEAVYQKMLAELPGPGSDRSIAVTDPELAAEWHPTKNGALTPEMVSAGSGELIWWRCARGHEWARAVYAKRKCPYCSNLLATEENSLHKLHPKIAKQWHPTKNLPATPDMVPAGSGKRYWWICERGHEWEREVEKRTKAGRGCPYCARRLLPRKRSA
jgi:very-short-patch-repair endonuclease/DNA-directed RNA polymerase subunit RPC12/RpoP